MTDDIKQEVLRDHNFRWIFSSNDVNYKNWLTRVKRYPLGYWNVMLRVLVFYGVVDFFMSRQNKQTDSMYFLESKLYLK